MAKVICVLYDDPVDGYPKSYPRTTSPARKVSERANDAHAQGHRFQARPAVGQRFRRTGSAQVFGSRRPQAGRHFGQGRRRLQTRRELPDAEIVISQPFWPAYMTAERIAKAPKLKLIITAGIGSDHTDLQAAIEAQRHRRRSHLLQQHQRGRARRDDDSGAGPQLHPLLRMGRQEGLEHRRLRRAVVRRRRNDRRHVRPPAASAWRFCGGSSRSTSSCTTPNGTACPQRSKKSWA